MLDEALADDAPSAVHDVEDAGRQAGVLENLDEPLGERGRVRRGLEDDRVAADERGRDLPAGDSDGEVPGRDRTDDSDRQADAHLELVRHLRGRRLSEHAPALTGHVVGHVDGFLDVAASFGAHLAHLLHHQVGELVLVLDERLRDAEEDLGALRRRDEAPALVGLLRGFDRPVCVLGRRPRELADQVARGRIRALEGLPAGGIDPLAANVVLVRLCARRRHLSPLSVSESDSTQERNANWRLPRRARFQQPAEN
jgi:hypothetical protein